MKINKILLLGYWGIIVLFLLIITIAGFTFKEKPVHSQQVRTYDYEQKAIELNTSKHVVIEHGCYVNISGDNTSKLLYSNSKKAAEIKPGYRLSNDTLYITSSKTNMGEWIDIHTNNLQSVTCTGSQISMYNINEDEITITGDRANVNISNNTSLTYATITLKNRSELQGWNYMGNALKLDITASNAQFSTNNRKLEVVEGTVLDNSNLRLPGAKQIKVDSDNSSSIKLY